MHHHPHGTPVVSSWGSVCLGEQKRVFKAKLHNSYEYFQYFPSITAAIFLIFKGQVF